MSQNYTTGCLSKGDEITILKRYRHPYVHCSITYSSQDMEISMTSSRERSLSWTTKGPVSKLHASPTKVANAQCQKVCAHLSVTQMLPL